MNTAQSTSNTNGNISEAGTSNETKLENLTSSMMQAIGEEYGKFYPYDSTATDVVEIPNTRVVTCCYKDMGKGKTRDNVYTRIPDHFTESLVTENISKLAPYVVTWLQDLEDASIKKYHKDGGLQVYVDGLGLDKIIAELEAAEKGARLNKEVIAAWFANEVADTLLLVFMEKLGIVGDATTEEEAQLAATLQVYCDKFCSLASGRTILVDAEKNNLIKAIQMSEAGNSTIGARLLSRLEGMSQKKADIMMAL